MNELTLDPISREWGSPHDPADVHLCDGAAEAIVRLRRAGFLVLMVSNQPSAAKGKCTLEALAYVHARVLELLAMRGAEPHGSYFCTHHPNGVVAGLTGSCNCRKPEPGLLLRARDEWGLDLCASWMVGDRESDVECGRRAGCGTILVQNALAPADAGRCRPDCVAAGLVPAVDWILSEVSAHARD